MSRVRELLQDCQIYAGGLNITGDVTERLISALEAVESAPSASTNNASPKLLSQLGIVEVLLRQQDYDAAYKNIVALIEQLRAIA